MTINSVKQEWQHFGFALSLAFSNARASTALHSLWASSLRSLDSERRKRQHLKKQVQWYDRRESKHISVPTTCEAECSSQCLVSDIMPYAY